MMMYYIDTTEQIKQDGELVEYGGKEKVADYNTATSKYFKKLSDVAADIGKNHTYMRADLVTSVGSVLYSTVVGSYDTGEEPEPNTEG